MKTTHLESIYMATQKASPTKTPFPTQLRKKFKKSHHKIYNLNICVSYLFLAYLQLINHGIQMQPLPL